VRPEVAESAVTGTGQLPGSGRHDEAVEPGRIELRALRTWIPHAVWHRAGTVRRLLRATVDAGAKAARLAPRLSPTEPDEPPGRTVFDVDARTLMDALEAIGAEPGEAAVAETLLDQLLEHTGARYGALLLRSGSGLRVAAQRADSPELFVSTSDVGTDDGELPLASLRDVLHNHQSHTVRDATVLSDGAASRRRHDAKRLSLLGVPLVSGGTCLGLAYLEDDRGGGAFDVGCRRLVEVLCAQAAKAIVNARLFARIDASRQELSAFNAVLEQRVEERTRALEHNYAALARLERQVAADAERQRLISDLHDGLGSQLLTTMRLLERSELDGQGALLSIRDCVADMRLLLDAAGSDANDLLAVWASLRERWSAQMAACGLATRWSLQTSLESIEVEPRRLLSLMRVVQESLSNAIRHARAGSVEVMLRCDERVIELTVRDDGIGCDGTERSGRGLASMSRRASALGARLRVEAAQPGTRVWLTCPVAAPPA